MDRNGEDFGISIETGAEVAPCVAIDRYRRYGSVVLRKALKAEEVAALADEVTDAFAQLDQRKHSLSDEDQRILNRMEMPVPAKDSSFRTRIENYRILDNERLRQIIQGIFGEFLWHFPPQIRRQTPAQESAFLPYHQDIAYNRHYERFVVCWTPLTNCGKDAPGLELAKGRFNKVLEHKPRGLWEAGIGEGDASEQVEKLPKYTPELKQGDVIIFDHLTLHRTYHHPQMTKTRLSIDFRAPAVAGISPEAKSSRKFVNPSTMKYV